MSNRPARLITDADRRRILRALEAHGARSFVALRTQAIALLAWDTALRANEIRLLELEQLVEDRARARPRIVSEFYLEPEQAKRRASGTVYLPKRVREGLGAYLLEAQRRGWIEAPPWEGPAFVTNNTAGSEHVRISKRAIQHAWRTWQANAGIRDPYRFHDLRHSAITAIAEAPDNVFQVAELGRFKNLRTPIRYVHSAPEKLRDLVESASSRKRDRERAVDRSSPRSPPPRSRRR